jgi:hypothetical protein
MNHLTDKELIDYTIKHSNDPLQVRLATVMERVSGAIIDDLVDAGMDETYCTFRSEWGGDYHPGRYITLLEDELKDRDYKIEQLHKELDNQKARTIADLIQELNQELHTMDWKMKETEASRMQAVKERDEAKSKLSMWAKLNADPQTLKYV